LGLFSEAGDPRLGLTLPIGDSGALLGVIFSSDDMVRLCRCAEIGPSFRRPVSEACTEHGKCCISTVMRLMHLQG